MADCHDRETRPETAWLWEALAHWTAEHGDPETGCQPLNGTVGKWVGVGASAMTAWRKGELWNLEWFAIVRARVGCDPATCDSPYADEDELSRKLQRADQEEKAHRRSALAPSRLPSPRTGTLNARLTGMPARATDPSVPSGEDEIRVALRKVDLADRRTVRAWEAVVPLLDDRGRAGVHLRDVYVTCKAQKVLVKGLRNQSVNRGSQGNAVLGEPGTGKSCVLWGVREELREAGWTVVAVSAAALLGTPDHPADLKVRELVAALEAKQSAVRAQQGSGRVALLLDTADLLLHDDTDEGRDRLVALVRRARALGVAVAIACRSVEARRLEEREPAGTGALLIKEHLEGYDDGRTAVSAVRNAGPHGSRAPNSTAPWRPTCGSSAATPACRAHAREADITDGVPRSRWRSGCVPRSCTRRPEDCRSDN
ncbi:ATP-binding protein [Streptomyces coeruleorubidus]|uniref:ATP-binding protein n=1 Tax=Streptomyces coeruleorubidus TaxID=116188 RepID=UPI001874F2B4|nr:ATP-binding protein [Streptomyces bellus]